MTSITTDLGSNLKMLGLTEYQARSLLALVSIGVGSPRDVASISGIPYPSAYDSLRSLAQSGWVEFASTRPAMFRIREPKAMKERMFQRVDSIFQKLQEKYEQIQEETSKITLIYTIVGREHVLGKLVEMIERAQSEIVAVIPSTLLRSNEVANCTIVDKLRALSTRRNMRLITDDVSAARGVAGNHVRQRQPILAVDLLVDQKLALIGLPDLSACGWVDSEAIASHFGQFLNLLWKDSSRPKARKTSE